MEHLVPVLQAIAPLAWVIFAFTALVIFKNDIRAVLGRIDEGEFFGQKLKLRKDLKKLEDSTAALNEETRELAPVENDVTDSTDEEKANAIINLILEQAAKSPKVALMMLWLELQRQALNGLAVRGMLRGRTTVPISHALGELRPYGFPANLEGSLELFGSVRNKIVHGGAATDDDALRALDSGMTILRALNSLPKEVNTIYHPGVDVFSDAACTKLIPGVKGVILEVTSPGGVMKTRRIFPTTRTHFQRGKEVAWEWNTGAQWPETWYRDPDTQEEKSAWGASAEFVGRHLDDIFRRYAAKVTEGQHE